MSGITLSLSPALLFCYIPSFMSTCSFFSFHLFPSSLVLVCQVSFENNLSVSVLIYVVWVGLTLPPAPGLGCISSQCVSSPQDVSFKGWTIKFVQEERT